MSHNTPKLVPDDSVEVPAPENLISFMPTTLTVRVYSTDGKFYYEVPSTAFLKVMPVCMPREDIVNHYGGTFRVARMPSSPGYVEDSVIRIMKANSEKDFIVPFGTKDYIPDGHTGGVYNVPPRGQRSYATRDGDIRNCDGLDQVA